LLAAPIYRAIQRQNQRELGSLPYDLPQELPHRLLTLKKFNEQHEQE
jgi:hypothetical protein